MARHRETRSSGHASLSAALPPGKAVGRRTHSGLEHRPDKPPARRGNAAGRFGKRVAVGRRGVEALDAVANFFLFFKALLKRYGGVTSFQTARLLAFPERRSEEIAHLKNAAASGEEPGGRPLPREG